jgi:soluble lytic murein transglycosylase
VRVARIVALVLVAACEHAGSLKAGGQAETPATVWIQRARDTPEIAGWLYLRAAGVTPDSAARLALYDRVDIAVARDRIPWVEAQALEHFNDIAGALRVYQTLPAPISVFRLRAALATSPDDRYAIRRDMLAFMASSSDAGLRRDSYALFDKLFIDPTPVEQLAIAHSAVAIGAWSRARTGFEHSGPVSALTPEDRFAYATALSRLNLDEQAARIYGDVDSPAVLAGAAKYQRARSLLVANGAEARAELRRLTARSDTNAAAALTLLADLETDDGNDAASRKLLLDLARRFPSSRFAPPARFNAALIAMLLGEPRTAETEFARLAADPSERIAATYWRGRAREALGNTAGARSSWRQVLASDSTSYYAMLAANRLGTTNMHEAPVSAGYPHVASVDSALVRIGLLNRFDMSPEIQFEDNRLYAGASADTTRRPTLLATAVAFSGTDQAARAIALGRRALARYGASADIYRLVYPVTARDTIVEESRKAGIDPVLVAALIRQESNFNPRATSAAGARGLMQVMPSVGSAIAKSAGITPWSSDRLYDPGINIMLGVRHLAPLIKRQPNLPRVLAAYNAGESRVNRWVRKRGASDPEMFTERIPFAETREYVKVVLRNREFYRALYAW